MKHAAPGATVWFIPDGYIPLISTGELESHESVCVLNGSEETAELRISVYFEDRDPIEDIPASVPGKRTKHIRTSGLGKDGQAIPPGVPYAMKVQSTVPVVVQYSRLDATQAANALMSVMAFPWGTGGGGA